MLVPLRLRLIYRIRRDEQTRTPPRITLPRLSFLPEPSSPSTDPPACSPPSPFEIEGYGPRSNGWSSEMIHKPQASDARGPYSIAQLKRMDRMFCRAMERAIRAGRERDLAQDRGRSK
jgi:hypothetical protein